MKHGANIYKYAQLLGCKSKKIIDFSSNINFNYPQHNINISKKNIMKYADTSYSKLKKVISKKYYIKKSQIALYNGATSAIYNLLSHLKNKHVYLYAPLYGEYEKACFNKKIHKINRLEQLDKKPKKNSIVIFVNPSTPDGLYYNLDQLYKIWTEQKCTIILDESFLEFENFPSFRNMINSNKNLYIIQSFSKFNSCAGVRIGAIFTAKKNIQKMKQEIWNISSIDEKILVKRLKDKEFHNKSRYLHLQQKEELFDILNSSKLFDKIYPSDSNFFLTFSKQADEIFHYLLRKKILTRTCGSFDYLSNKYIRFAVKDKKSNYNLKKALNEFS